MPLTASCPGCGKTIAAPDSAAGRKARCPQCGQVVDLPGGGPALTELAAAVGRAGAAQAGAAGAAAQAQGPAPAAAVAAPAARTPTPSAASLSSTRTSVTTQSRLLVRGSPYRTMRLLAAVSFGGGVALAALALAAGLVALILISISGHPLSGAGVFVGALAAAAGVFLAGKILSEALHLGADVGDRMRQMTHMMEDWVGRGRENGL